MARWGRGEGVGETGVGVDRGGGGMDLGESVKRGYRAGRGHRLINNAYEVTCHLSRLFLMLCIRLGLSRAQHWLKLVWCITII